jgi:hypothetical protein
MPNKNKKTQRAEPNKQQLKTGVELLEHALMKNDRKSK